MTENLSRFGFSEMMNVLRDAVCQSRETSGSLNARDVSKYIQTRYGFNKKKTGAPSVPAIQHLDQADSSGQTGKKRSTSVNSNFTKEPAKDAVVKEPSRARSLPRQLSVNAHKEAKKSTSGTLLVNTPYDYYAGEEKVPVQADTDTISENDKWTDIKINDRGPQKEEQFKEMNLRKQARKFIANVSGTLMPEKSTYEILARDDNRVQKLSSLGMSRSIDADAWYPRKKLDDIFHKRDDDIKEKYQKQEAKITEAKKVTSGVTRKAIVTQRLAAKQMAMKQAAAGRGKKHAQPNSKISPLSLKGQESKTWLQLRAIQDKVKNSKSKSFLENLPSKCETMVRRTREARARLIEDLKLAEQRKQIEVLRIMARDTLNKHLEEAKQLRKANNYF